MNKKSGKAGTLVAPIAPAEVHEADVADPGKVAEIKAEQVKQKKGKYGKTAFKPFKPPATEKEKVTKPSWIEIELVGVDDKPIAGERYRVMLPDGTVAEGTLDPNGWVRVEGFAEGGCKVAFPDLDADAWEYIEAAGPKPPGKT